MSCRLVNEDSCSEARAGVTTRTRHNKKERTLATDILRLLACGLAVLCIITWWRNYLKCSPGTISIPRASGSSSTLVGFLGARKNQADSARTRVNWDPARPRRAFLPGSLGPLPTVTVTSEHLAPPLGATATIRHLRPTSVALLRMATLSPPSASARTQESSPASSCPGLRRMSLLYPFSGAVAGKD